MAFPFDKFRDTTPWTWGGKMPRWHRLIPRFLHKRWKPVSLNIKHYRKMLNKGIWQKETHFLLSSNRQHLHTTSLCLACNQEHLLRKKPFWKSKIRLLISLNLKLHVLFLCNMYVRIKAHRSVSFIACGGGGPLMKSSKESGQ